MLKFLLFSAYILSDFFTPQGNFISHLATVRMIQKDIYAWDIQDAEKKLKKLPKNSPFFSYLKGYILFFNGNYKEAMSYLEKAVDELNSNEVINLYNLVKNTYEETKDFKHVETPHFIISYMPGKSEILIPMAKETLEKAWENVGEDLGYYPLEKIRVEIYP